MADHSRGGGAGDGKWVVEGGRRGGQNALRVDRLAGAAGVKAAAGVRVVAVAAGMEAAAVRTKGDD